MAKRLTKKQQGFVKTYVQTGIATLAAKKNYNVTNENSAGAVGSEVLSNPKVQAAIANYADGIPDVLLREKHLALLNKTDIKRTFDHTTGEWIDIETGQVETNAVTKGLDMAYKLKGSYAPERSASINLNLDHTVDDTKLAALDREYEAKVRALYAKGND